MRALDPSSRTTGPPRWNVKKASPGKGNWGQEAVNAVPPKLVLGPALLGGDPLWGVHRGLSDADLARCFLTAHGWSNFISYYGVTLGGSQRWFHLPLLPRAFKGAEGPAELAPGPPRPSPDACSRPLGPRANQSLSARKPTPSPGWCWSWILPLHNLRPWGNWGGIVQPQFTALQLNRGATATWVPFGRVLGGSTIGQ